MVRLLTSWNGSPLLGLLILLSLITLPLTALSGEDDAYYKLPIPDDFAPALQPDGTPQYVTAEEIEKNIKEHSLEFRKLYRDRTMTRFIIPRHDWLQNFLVFYDALLKEANVRGKANTWDCENYSGLLNALITVRIWKAGHYDTRGAVGWMMVNAKKEWAGMPGVLHALMFAVTGDGLFIIEPQNGQTVSLEKYPNRQFIQEAYLF